MADIEGCVAILAEIDRDRGIKRSRPPRRAAFEAFPAPWFAKRLASRDWLRAYVAIWQCLRTVGGWCSEIK